MSEERTLKYALEKAGHEHGVQIKRLARGDILTILIGNKMLTVKMINPEDRKVMVIEDEGGVMNPNSTIYILGSSLSGTGSMLKIGWIAVDYLICIEFDRKEFSGYTKKVWLNKQLVLPYNENN